MPRPDSIATLRSKLNAIQVGNLVGASAPSDTSGKGSDKNHASDRKGSDKNPASLQTESTQVKGGAESAEKRNPTDGLRAEKMVVSEANGTTAASSSDVLVDHPPWLCMEKVLHLFF